MILFHGSDHVIVQPEYGVGKSYNDYGPGFYCTESLDMAKEWSARHGSVVGYANKYTLDTSGLDVLNLDGKEYCTLHWLAVLLENRDFAINTALSQQARSFILERFLPDYKSRDIVCGYRADDSYFSFARAFLNGGISYEQLGRAMRLGNLGKQVVLKSPVAFERIAFEGAEEAAVQVWLPKRERRDIRARRKFAQLSNSGFDASGLYIQEILRENMDATHARLQ